MKFGIKVLFWNLTLVLAALAISGYLFIRHNYKVALNTEIQNGLEENQMLRTVLQSEIVKLILYEEYNSIYSLQDTGESLAGRFQGIRSTFILMDKEYKIIYSSDQDTFEYTQVFQNLEAGKKNYIITRKDHKYLIYIASILGIEDESLFIVNKKDITSLYRNIEQQTDNYRMVTLSTIVFCGVAMFIISFIMTRSIRKLNETATVIAGGNYSARTAIKSRDEIGELGDKFNLMGEAVESHIEQLIKEAKKQEEFVANFTHELKTPLTAVIGYSDMLRLKNMSEEDRVMAADYIYQESMRLETMSMKLSDLIFVDKVGIVKKKIYMEILLEDIIRSVSPIFKKEGIRLKQSIRKGCMLGDGDILKSAFINLLDNARKASKKGGTVLVKSYNKESRYIVEVMDNGVGIPREELWRITEAFYMVDKSRTRKSGGVGLGLALAAKIIELHEGVLTPISEVHKGTTMKVSFEEVPDEK